MHPHPAWGRAGRGVKNFRKILPGVGSEILILVVVVVVEGGEGVVGHVILK